jgi:hypothetical protein
VYKRQLPYTHPKNKEDTVWWKFEQHLHQHISGVLEDILRDPSLKPSPEAFWSIVEVYNLVLDGWLKSTAYEFLPIPILIDNNSSSIQWETLRSISAQGLRLFLTLADTRQTSSDLANIPIDSLNIGLCDSKKLGILLKSIVRTVTIMHLENNRVVYNIEPFNTPFNKLADSHYTNLEMSWYCYQVYGDSLDKYLLVHNLAEGANYYHPAIQFIFETIDRPSDPYKWFRWGMFALTHKLANRTDFYTVHPSEWSEETSRGLKLTASHWSKVNWARLPIEAQPPYLVYDPESGTELSITLEFLKELHEHSGAKEAVTEKKLTDLT